MRWCQAADTDQLESVACTGHGGGTLQNESESHLKVASNSRQNSGPHYVIR